MGRTDLSFFRSFLEKSLKDLLSKSEELTASISQANAPCPDIADQAAQEADLDLLLAVRARNRARAAEIRAALTRLDHGAYGVCEECGEDIGLARLKANPAATLCVSCKHQIELALRAQALAV